MSPKCNSFPTGLVPFVANVVLLPRLREAVLSSRKFESIREAGFIEMLSFSLFIIHELNRHRE
jgi:hypothetical protein